MGCRQTNGTTHNAQESRHMQMSSLVSYQLQYPDMTIRDFFAMAESEI